MAFRAVESLLGVMALSTILGAVKSEQDPKYDLATVVDFAAVVTEVREAPKENPLSGVNLVVRTESDATMAVYVCPVSFLKSFEITLVKGDRIHVTGSKVRFSGGYVVLAREVRRDSATLYLRDRNGAPYWQPDGAPSS